MRLLLIFILCAIATYLPSSILALTPYEESTFFHNFVPERLLILIVSRLGLANRLRTIADWYQIANLSNRTLLVSWEATPDCNAKFTDLFVDGPPRLRFLQEHLPSGDEGVRYVAELANKRNISNIPIYNHHDMESNFFVDQYKSFVISKSIPFSDAEVMITHYDGIATLEGVYCQQYMMMNSQFLSSLVPNQEARDFIREMKATHFHNRIMVGVHYRTHDDAQDWAVVPPLMGVPEAKTFGVGSTMEDFLRAMSKIQQQFIYTDRHGEVKSLVRFFVASNNETEKARFRKLVPDGIFLFGEHKRGTENGMQFALLEWLALSESALLLNTYGSSFAEQASMVHQRPLVGIWDGLLVHHLSVYLPYCGHLQFAKSHSAQGVKSSYVEGTFDQREVSIYTQ